MWLLTLRVRALLNLLNEFRKIRGSFATSLINSIIIHEHEC